MTSLRGVMIFLLLLNVSVACENGDPVSPSTPPPPPPITPAFSGQVLIPSYQTIRNYSVPVEGVTVTIIAGPRSGERAQTNHNGWYTFPEVDGEELHIRLEKDGHEPKEVIVHRTRATTLQDRLPLEYGGPQDKPGTVLIGIVWPEYAKQIMEKMPVVADLLMIIVPGGRGQYGFWFHCSRRPQSYPGVSPSGTRVMPCLPTWRGEAPRWRVGFWYRLAFRVGLQSGRPCLPRSSGGRPTGNRIQPDQRLRPDGC